MEKGMAGAGSGLTGNVQMYFSSSFSCSVVFGGAGLEPGSCSASPIGSIRSGASSDVSGSSATGLFSGLSTGLVCRLFSSMSVCSGVFGAGWAAAVCSTCAAGAGWAACFCSCLKKYNPAMMTRAVPANAAPYCHRQWNPLCGWSTAFRLSHTLAEGWSQPEGAGVSGRLSKVFLNNSSSD